MTSCLISVALLFTPAPLTAPKEAPQWPINVLPESVVSVTPPTTSFVVIPTSATTLVVETTMPANGAPMTSISEPVEPTNPPTPAELVDELFGWPGPQLVTCESSWNRWAVGRYGERGPLQIHPVHARPGGIIEQLGYTFDDMFEWIPNLLVAVEIRRVQGLRAWTCWKGN